MSKRCKWIFSLVLVGLLMLAAPVMATPTVNLDGKQLSFEVPPSIENGRTLVPLRAIFEAIGATVTWDQATYSATAIKGDTTVILHIGSTTPTINGQVKQLDVPAKIVDGRTLAPLRFVGEAFGGTVEWNQASQLISITSIPTSGTPPPAAAEIYVHFIDVGQADSIYVQLPNHNDILIDGGNAEDGQLVVDYLKAKGVDDIELMIATHPHEDHIGGLPAVLDAFVVEKVIDSGKLHTTNIFKTYLTKVKAEGAIYEQDNYQSLAWGNVSLQILTSTEAWEELNDYSVVCRLDTGNIEFLFTGDAGTSVENILTGDISAEILKVGHHGSTSSSSASFLSRVNPQVAIISVGTGNTYGHPTAQTLSRLQATGTTIYRTDLNGNIVVTTDGNTYSVATDTNLQVPAAVVPITQPAGTAPALLPGSDQNTSWVYVGSIKSNKYHLPSCRYATAIDADNQVWFASEAEAIVAGYVPCGVCKP